jgi:hypothetical protein
MYVAGIHCAVALGQRFIKMILDGRNYTTDLPCIECEKSVTNIPTKEKNMFSK